MYCRLCTDPSGHACLNAFVEKSVCRNGILLLHAITEMVQDTSLHLSNVAGCTLRKLDVSHVECFTNLLRRNPSLRRSERRVFESCDIVSSVELSADIS